MKTIIAIGLALSSISLATTVSLSTPLNGDPVGQRWAVAGTATPTSGSIVSVTWSFTGCNPALFTECTGTFMFSGTNWTGPIDFIPGSVPSGAQTLVVTATDSAMNSGSRTISVTVIYPVPVCANTVVNLPGGGASPYTCITGGLSTSQSFTLTGEQAGDVIFLSAGVFAAGGAKAILATDVPASGLGSISLFQPEVFTGSAVLVNGSPTIHSAGGIIGPSTNNVCIFFKGQLVTGTGIPAGTYLLGCDNTQTDYYLSAPVTISATETVTMTYAFPVSTPFILTLFDTVHATIYEQIQVTLGAPSGGMLTGSILARGLNNTTAVAHLASQPTFVGWYDTTTANPFTMTCSAISNTLGYAWNYIGSYNTSFTDDAVGQGASCYARVPSNTSTPDVVTMSYAYPVLGDGRVIQAEYFDLIQYRGLGLISGLNIPLSGWAGPDGNAGNGAPTYAGNAAMTSSGAGTGGIANSWNVSSGDLCIGNAGGSVFQVANSATVLVPSSPAVNPSTTNAWQLRVIGTRSFLLDAVANSTQCNGGALVVPGDGVTAIGVAFHPSGGVEQSYVTSNNTITSNSVTGPSAGTPWVLQAKIDVFPTTMSASPVIWDARGAVAPGPLGAYIQLISGPTQLQVNMNNETGQSATMGAFINAAPVNGMYLTVMHDAAAAGTGHSNTDTLLIWNPLTATVLYTSTATYATNIANGSGVISIGGAASPNAVNWAFMRICTGASTTATATSLALQMPTTGGGCPTGANIIEWNGAPGNTTSTTLVDQSGNTHTGTVNTGTITFTPTTYTGIVSVVGALPPLGAPRPAWTNQPTLRAGVGNQLTASASVTECYSSNALAYLWSNVSGPGATPSFSSTTVVNPTVTGLTDTTVASLDYTFGLQVADTCGNAPSNSSLELGVVTMDTNGIVIPLTAHEGEIFGPQIAFAQNPWSEADRQPWAIYQTQQAFQAQYPTVGFGGQVGQNDWSWTTTAAGTVSYPFAGFGFLPGPASCMSNPVVLTSTLNPTDTTVSITNPGCLSLASLPTWIMVGNFAFGSGSRELIRVVSVASGSIAGPTVVLNIGYDGRWMAGNANLSASPTTISVAWTAGTGVGEMRVQGSGTSFLSDPLRPLAPAGAASASGRQYGPMGQVSASLSNVGTITLSTGSYTGSATVSGSGTSWTSAMVGSYIWLQGTHSGTPFNFWCQITVVAGAGSLTCNRPAPAGIDSLSYTAYKILTPIYLSLEANAPTDGHLIRFLQNGMGCESQTACFAVAEHDIPSLDTTTQMGIHASYKMVLTAYQGGGLFPEFYGTGCGDNLRMFYRSGLRQWLTLATPVCQNWVRDPQIGDGYAGGDPLNLGGPAIAAMWYVTLQPSNGVLAWNNVEDFASYGYASLLQSGVGPASCSVLDTRETGIEQQWTGLAANYDTNATNAAIFTGYLGSMLTRAQGCARPASQGYVGAEVNSFANTFNWNPQAGPFTLTAGSPIVAGTGFSPGTCSGVDMPTVTVTNGLSTFTYTGTLTQQTFLWIYDNTDGSVAPFTYTLGTPNRLGAIWKGTGGMYAAMSTNDDQDSPSYTSIWSGNADYPIVSAAVALANNRGLEKAWPCVYNSPTQLTLLRNWDGPPGGAYFLNHFNVGIFNQQQFFHGGYFANSMYVGSHSTNSGTAAGYAATFPLLGAWFNSYGWDSVNNHGTFYSGVWQGCSTTNSWTAAGSFPSISGGEGCGNNGLAPGSAAIERVDSVEGGFDMLLAVVTGQASKAIGDEFYGAIYSVPSLCWASVASTCSDGQYAQPNPTTAGAQLGKWPGFYNGVGGNFTAGYPAVSVCMAGGGTIIGFTCHPAGTSGESGIHGAGAGGAGAH